MDFVESAHTVNDSITSRTMAEPPRPRTRSSSRKKDEEPLPTRKFLVRGALFIPGPMSPIHLREIQLFVKKLENEEIPHGRLGCPWCFNPVDQTLTCGVVGSGFEFDPNRRIDEVLGWKIKIVNWIQDTYGVEAYGTIEWTLTIPVSGGFISTSPMVSSSYVVGRDGPETVEGLEDWLAGKRREHGYSQQLGFIEAQKTMQRARMLMQYNQHIRP